MLFHSSLFFKFWISCQDARKLNKVKFKFKLFQILIFFSCAQMLIFLTQLTAFTVFEICRKLNSACCNYSLQSLKKFPSLLSSCDSKISHFRWWNWSQILCKKSVEISYQHHSKNFQRFLLYSIRQNSDYFKTEKKQRKLFFIELVSFIHWYLILVL